MLADAFGETEGFTRIWVYSGNESAAADWARALELADPVLADADNSLRVDYFIPNGDNAFASNPRHFVIDAEGVLRFVQTTVAPDELEGAIRGLLEE